MYKIPASTLFMGKRLVFVPECHSTNTLAHELAQSSPIEDGTVVITDHQTAGRGQRGSAWEAEKGKNLTFTLVLRPTFLPIKDQFFLNIFTSLAISDLLRSRIGGGVTIKWPNDLLVNGKKLCGILIENQIQGAQVSKSLIGIGINVNQEHFNHPNATSMSREAKSDFSLPLILEELLGNLEAAYLQLKEGKMSALKARYQTQLFWLNEKHQFSSAGRIFDGTLTGIDSSGRLVISTGEGLRSFQFKEVSFIY